MKILHVVENLDKGAVENWLVNVFEQSRKYRPNWEWTFFCILNKPGCLDERVKGLGGKIIYAPFWISNRFLFLKSLRSLLLREKFDIIHAHHDFLSGFYLISTIGIKELTVINHVHNADEIVPVGNSRLQKLLLYPLASLAGIISDKTIGISNYTLKKFRSKQLVHSKFSRVLYYGINLKKFSKNIGYDLRSELGIDPSIKILLFIGRFNREKNPSFLIDIAVQLRKSRNDFVMVFVGQGEQENLIKEKAELFDCKNIIYILGWRDDVSQIMLDSDIFVFPRLQEPKEGLGLVVVEAQSAGLPTICTNGILDDAIIIPELVDRIALDRVEDWVLRIDSILSNPLIIKQNQAIEEMEKSPFEINNATFNLLELYEGE